MAPVSLVSRAAALALATLAALLGIGCESTPDNRLAPGHSGEGVRRVLLFPMNLFVPLSPSLEAGAARVGHELEDYLLARGRSVERIDVPSAQRYWQEALRAVETPGRAQDEDVVLDAALSRLARDVSRAYRFDALMLPSIVGRPALRKGLKVRWDGVVRELEIPPRSKRGGYTADLRSRMDSRPAEMTAPSLWTLVMLPDGTRVFDGFGGLDLTIRGQWVSPYGEAGTERDLRLEIVPIDDPLQDEEALREGVARSLDPYVPRSGDGG